MIETYSRRCPCIAAQGICHIFFPSQSKCLLLFDKIAAVVTATTAAAAPANGASGSIMRGPVEDEDRDEIDGDDVRCSSAVRKSWKHKHGGRGSSNFVIKKAKEERVVRVVDEVVHIQYIVVKRDG